MPQINYKSDDTVKDAFLHSCLGKLVILAGFVVILLLIAYFTAPSEKEMTTNMEDNVMQCLQENDSIQGDPIDDYVNNIGFIFTKADTTKIFPDLIKAYRDLNRMEIYHHSLYTTSYLFNNMHPQGIRVGIGGFGLVFPTVTFSSPTMTSAPILTSRSSTTSVTLTIDGPEGPKSYDPGCLRHCKECRVIYS